MTGIETEKIDNFATRAKKINKMLRLMENRLAEFQLASECSVKGPSRKMRGDARIARWFINRFIVRVNTHSGDELAAG